MTSNFLPKLPLTRPHEFHLSPISPTSPGLPTFPACHPGREILVLCLAASSFAWGHPCFFESREKWVRTAILLQHILVPIGTALFYCYTHLHCMPICIHPCTPLPGILTYPSNGTTYEASQIQRTAYFQMKLDTQPVGEVLVSVASDDLTEGIAFPPVLAFNSTNWNTLQTFFVHSIDDIQQDGDITYKVCSLCNWVAAACNRLRGTKKTATAATVQANRMSETLCCGAGCTVRQRSTRQLRPLWTTKYQWTTKGQRMGIQLHDLTSHVFVSN